MRVTFDDERVVLAVGPDDADAPVVGRVRAELLQSGAVRLDVQAMPPLLANLDGQTCLVPRSPAQFAEFLLWPGDWLLLLTPHAFAGRVRGIRDLVHGVGARCSNARPHRLLSVLVPRWPGAAGVLLTRTAPVDPSLVRSKPERGLQEVVTEPLLHAV